LLFFLIRSPPSAIYTLSLHDALPISLAGGGRKLLDLSLPAADRPVELRRAIPHRHPGRVVQHDRLGQARAVGDRRRGHVDVDALDRKSTRLNSSHVKISYAVFCLKKK